MTIVAVASIALAVAAAVVVVWLRLSWRRVVRRRVSVVIDSDRTFIGVLWARRGTLLVLRDASTVDDGKSIRFDGEVIVDRARVQWVQVLG